MNEYVVESFIDRCDELMLPGDTFTGIVTEGIISTVRGGLEKAWKTFVRILKEIGRRIADMTRVLFGKKTSGEKALEEKYMKELANDAKIIKQLKSTNLDNEVKLRTALHTIKQMEEKHKEMGARYKEEKEISDSRSKMLNDASSKAIKYDELEKDIKMYQRLIQEAIDSGNEKDATIRKLKNRVEDLIEQEERHIMNKYKWAKERLEKGKNINNILDQWGYVEFCLKAFPPAQKLSEEVIKIIHDAGSGKFDHDKIDNIQEKVADQFSTCKSIFRHSEQESARQNPKEYSESILEDLLDGMKRLTGKLESEQFNLRKLFEKNVTNNLYAAGTVNVKGTSDDVYLNKVFALSINLVSVLESYSSMLYKVTSMCDIYRPHNRISYRNYKGDYNYKGSDGHSQLYERGKYEEIK